MTLCSNTLGWNAVCGSKPCHSSRTSVLSFPAWFTCLPRSGSGPGPGVSQPGSGAQGANAIHVQRARSEKRSTVRQGQFFYFDNIHSEYCYWIWQMDHIVCLLIGGRELLPIIPWCTLLPLYGLSPESIIPFILLLLDFYSSILLACFVPATPPEIVR